MDRLISRLDGPEPGLAGRCGAHRPGEVLGVGFWFGARSWEGGGSAVYVCQIKTRILPPPRARICPFPRFLFWSPLHVFTLVPDDLVLRARRRSPGDPGAAPPLQPGASASPRASRWGQPFGVGRGGQDSASRCPGRALGWSRALEPLCGEKKASILGLRFNSGLGQGTLEEVRGTGVEGPNGGEGCCRRVGGKRTVKRLHPGCPTL